VINAASELAQEFWAKSRLEDCPILDFHGHMGDFAGLFMPRKSAEGMLLTMDACNVVLICFCGHEALGSPSVGVARDMKAARRHPGRFKVYHSVVSRHLDPEADLKRMAENPDIFVGFKFHPDSCGVPLSDPRHDPYWEYADSKGLLVLSHTWGGSAQDGPEEVGRILDRYHNLVFIAGHSFHDHWQRAAELALAYPNLYLELTAVLDNRGGLDILVEKVGSERILFGTDLPWFSTHYGIGAVLAAKMDDEDRRNIFHRNGAKLLTRFPWFAPIWEAKGPRAG
jgi:predicted TIM-barrel fold metal-dependent hydrolase